MMILLDDRILHRKKQCGLHRKFKLQMEVLSHNHYIILIVLVLLIQVYDRYFYLHLILKQCQHQVEEVNVHKVRIEKFHRPNERLELNKNYYYDYYYSFVIILHIQIFTKIIFFLCFCKTSSLNFVYNTCFFINRADELVCSA